ncbi:hypothetical protein FALB51S_03613 [Frigidibacter albus]
MLILFRWLLRIVSALLALTLAVALLIYYVAAGSLPDYDDRRTVEGLSAPLEIVRDTGNVPHVFGSSDADVYFGLGYAHAQDRLWQMTMLRRTAQGRLSEIFGARTVKLDELMRRLDLYRLAATSVPAQDEQTRIALEAYARGVNEWIRVVNEESRGRGAPEFFLFEPEIAYWQPADSLAILKLIGVQLSSHLSTEVLRARLSLLSRDWPRDLMPEVPGAGVMELPDYAQLVPGVPASGAALRQADLGPFSPFPERGLEGASNAWAAAPERAAAGGSLLASDPHLGFTAPALWYLARLELASGGVIGGTIPGVPAVLVGRNAGLGWGLTSSYADDQDLMIEELNPADSTEYRTPEGWETFRSRRVIVNVKDAAPVTLTLRWTQNGPVLPGGHYDIGSVTPRGHVAALAWTLLDAGDTSMTAAIRLMQAQSIEEGVAAGELVVAPSQNLVLADEDGVAMVTVGRLPARDAAHETQGRMPALGWKPQNRWTGRLPYDSNPRVVNPEGGILGNTNNKTVDRPFPNHVSFDWGDSQRIQRWQRLMQEREVHSREKFHRRAAGHHKPRGAQPAAAGRRRSVVHRRGCPRRHARGTARARTGAAGRMERRDERASARAADLCRLDAGAAATADPGRTGAAGHQLCPDGAAVHRAGVPQCRGRRALVRHPAILAGGELHRYRPPGAGRCPAGADRALWTQRRKLALGRRASGDA